MEGDFKPDFIQDSKLTRQKRWTENPDELVRLQYCPFS